MPKTFTPNWEPEHNPHTDYVKWADKEVTTFTLKMYLDTLYRMPLAQHYQYWGAASHANIPAAVIASADNFVPVGQDDTENVYGLTYLAISKFIGTLHLTWSHILNDCGGLTSYTEDEFRVGYYQLLMKTYYNLFSYVDAFIHCPTAVYSTLVKPAENIIDITIDEYISSDTFEFKPMYPGETLKDRFCLYTTTFLKIVELLFAAHDVCNTKLMKYYKATKMISITPEAKKIIKKLRNTQESM